MRLCPARTPADASIAASMDLGSFFRKRRFYESPWAIRGYRALRAGAERLGFQVVLKTFYSPIPDLDGLPPGWFDRASELPGVDLGLDRQLALLEQRLAGPMSEFAEPPANPSYSHFDSAVLYAMLRWLRPRRVIELGSGHSSLVAAQAVRRNAADGSPCTYEVHDPFPSVVSEALPGLSALHRTAAQDVPLGLFEELGAGDVLFVDTTHTVKMGSDVNHIVLEVLPRLAPGVAVHVHDVFLPFEYPEGFAAAFGLYWAEQYLLQAFLSMNRGYEVLFANAALERLRTSEQREQLPPGTPAGGGSAFWLRRTED